MWSNTTTQYSGTCVCTWSNRPTVKSALKFQNFLDQFFLPTDAVHFMATSICPYKYPNNIVLYGIAERYYTYKILMHHIAAGHQLEWLRVARVQIDCERVRQWRKRWTAPLPHQ